MGRPLKIAKNNGTVDAGYPQTASGVVGGNTGQAGNQIVARVKIGTQAEGAGYIIRQKGKKKFLVGSTASIQDEDIVAGNIYVITSLGTTDWTYFGINNAAVGRIFTAPVDGSGLTTTGVVNRVGVCTLANTANGSLANNTMTVVCTKADSSTFRARTITNHFVTDFSGNKFIADNASNAGTTPPTVAVAVS